MPEPIESSGAPPAWAASPAAELWRLSWPLALAAVSYTLKPLVDTLLVGRLGSSELAGVGLGGTVAFLLLCFPIGVLDGLRVLVAQARGASRADAVRGYLRAALVLSGALGVGCALLGVLVVSSLDGLGATGRVGLHASEYFGISLVGAPVVLVHTALKDGREGQGDTRWPMVSAVVGNVVNVVLDLVFIFGLDGGVAGAAWASVAAAAVEAAIVLLIQLRDGFGPPTIAGRDLRSLWSLGMPLGLQFVLGAGAFSLMAILVARMGEAQMAGHQIALHVTHLCFLPTTALCGAVSVMVGQAIGAGHPSLLPTVSRLALRLQLAYVGVVASVLWSGGEWVARAFTADPATLSVVVGLLRISAVLQMLDGSYSIARAGLRGAGDVRVPAVVGMIIAWGCTPPLTWLLGQRLGLGATGGWLGLCLEMLVGAAVMWWRLERGGWRASTAQLKAQTAPSPTDPTDPEAGLASAPL